MIFGQGRSQWRDRFGETVTLHLNGVYLTLDNNGAIVAMYVFAGKVKSKNRFAFMKYFRIRGVDIFGFGSIQTAP